MLTLQPSIVPLIVNDTLKKEVANLCKVGSQNTLVSSIKGYDYFPPILISSNCITVNRMDRYLHRQRI